MFNARKLNNKLHELHDVLVTESLDMLCITETWLKPSTPDSLLINGMSSYSVFRKDGADSQGEGVCLITNCDTVQAIRVEIDVKYMDLDLLCIDILNTCLRVRVIVGYRPPSSETASDVIQSTNHFIECLRSLCNVDASIVLVGDFNFPNIDWSNLQFSVDNDRCSTFSLCLLNSIALTSLYLSRLDSNLVEMIHYLIWSCVTILL